MNNKVLYSILSTIILLCQLCGQDYPTYNSPVKHTIRLSGSFAELRTGHFHSGIDIKSSRGIAGDSIQTIQKGTISRIKVEPGGYGNSVYIDHPEGYTSVYAHLQEFNSKIDSIVCENQNSKKTFTIDLTAFGDLAVSAGEYIGIMGNSGRSFGPHLHFEIRESKTDKLINPFLFGIKPSDKKKPRISGVKLRVLDNLNLIRTESQLTTAFSKIGESYYYDIGAISRNSNSNYELSVNLFDQMDGSSNKNGIYQIEWNENGTLIHQVNFDDLAFNDSEAIYQMMDLKAKQDSKSTRYVFQLDTLFDFTFVNQYGSLIEVQDSDKINHEIRFFDYHCNESVLRFETSYINNIDLTGSACKPNYIIENEAPSIFTTEHFKIIANRGSTIHRQGVYINEIQNSDEQTLILRPKYIALTKPLKVFITPPSQFRDKFAIVKTDIDGDKVIHELCEKGTNCMTSISSLHDLSISIDTIPPSVKLMKKFVKSSDQISFTIQDNLKPGKKSLYLKYDVFINDNWQLFNYDLKSNRIYKSINNTLPKGPTVISVIVSDSTGNEACHDFIVNIT